MNPFTDYRFLLLFLIPLAIGGYYYWIYLKNKNNRRSHWYSANDSDNFNTIEHVLLFVVFLLVSVFLYNWGVNNRIGNYREEIGGYIIQKYSVDGEHQESEETCTGSGDDRTCTTRHWTEYHTEYFLKSNIGDWYSGSNWYQRVNKPNQFTPVPDHRVPAYWTQAYVGKPVSWSNGYKNYISAINDEKYKRLYEQYSLRLEDICTPEYNHRLNEDSVYKAIPLGFTGETEVFKNVESWNFSPAVLNQYDVSSLDDYKDVPLYMDTTFGYLGGEVQGDTNIYIVNSTSLEYADFCMAKWRGGSKNGIFVFIFGQSDGTSYKATDVVVKLGVDGNDENTGFELDNEASRSNEGMKYDIRKQLLEHFKSGGELEREKVLTIVFDNVQKSFLRQEMANFKELKKQVKPTGGWIFGMSVFLMLAYLASTYYLANNDN